MTFIIANINVVPTIQSVDNVSAFKLPNNLRHILVLADGDTTALAAEARYTAMIQRPGKGRLDLRVVTVQEVVDPADGPEGVSGRQLLGSRDCDGQEVHDMDAGSGVKWLHLVGRRLSVG